LHIIYDINSGSKTDCTAGGKGSQNSLNTTSGDKNAIEMFNEILKYIQKSNDLMNGMNGEKDKALTALQEIRQVVDNTDTESTTSFDDKTCDQMSGNYVDFESVANTST
jgi:hypothetical protein